MKQPGKSRETTGLVEASAEPELFEMVVRRAAAPAPIAGIVIGRMAGFAASGGPLVDFCENPRKEPIEARSIAASELLEEGCELALMFEEGDPQRPIILGRMHSPASTASRAGPQIEADGERLVLSAEREIVLRCGDASITLRQDGRVVVRGKHILSRSSGPNRIKGGSVQIN